MVIGDTTATVNRSSSSNTSSSSGNVQSGQELQEQFMTMLIAQMKNQDPMNPTENSEMTSQMAQINTVSGIQDLNESLKGINSQISTSQQLQTSALVDRGVLVKGDNVLVTSEADKDPQTTPFGISLGADADTVRVDMVGDDGQAVRSFNLGKQSAGVQTMSWDGRAENGEAVATGKYHVTINATKGGQPVSVDALQYARVNGVAQGQNGGRLDLGVYGSAELSDVYQIF